MASNITDLTRGIYRRIYSGAITGRRINKVSIGAEFWFWRLHMIADDFGRFPADPRICRLTAAPLRDDEETDNNRGGPRHVWTSDVRAWLNELDRAELITRYEARGESYGLVCDWEELQPRNRSGRRIERYPAPEDGPPAEDGSKTRGGTDPAPAGIFDGLEPVMGKSGNPGESQAVPGNKSHSESESESEIESKSESKSKSESEAKEELSISDSISDSLQVQKAKTAFSAAVSGLIGRDHDTRHAPGSKQHNADITVFNLWCEEIVDGGIYTHSAVARYKRATKLAKKAAGQARPMAYLTGCLKGEGLIRETINEGT